VGRGQLVSNDNGLRNECNMFAYVVKKNSALSEKQRHQHIKIWLHVVDTIPNLFLNIKSCFAHI